MITITIYQPYASLICMGIKDIENRTWKLPEKYKGQRVLVHASAKPVKMINPNNVFSYQQWESLSPDQKLYLIGGKIPNSSIIGSVEIVDCVVNHHSIWAEKSELIIDEKKVCQPMRIYNLVLANPILFDKPIHNVKGQQRFWDYPFPILEPDGVHRY